MLQLLPKNESLKVDLINKGNVLQYLSDYIDRYCCEKLEVDITSLNVIDAVSVSTICSAKHYVKYPQGKLTWKISSELVSMFGKDLQLGNSEYIL